MQNDYSKEDCIVYSWTGTCEDCREEHRCTIRKVISEQTDDMSGRLIVAAIIAAFLFGLWL